jgi:ABC-type polysaccharide/polyol phosphate export permease
VGVLKNEMMIKMNKKQIKDLRVIGLNIALLLILGLIYGYILVTYPDVDEIFGVPFAFQWFFTALALFLILFIFHKFSKKTRVG